MALYNVLSTSLTDPLHLTLGLLSISLPLLWHLRRGKHIQPQNHSNAPPPSWPFDPASLDRSQSESPNLTFGNNMILPNRYAHEIRNNDVLSFRDGLEKDFLTTVPGLESMFTGTFHNHIVWDTASAFSRKLGALIEPLSTETGIFLRDNWSDDTEWHSISLDETMHLLIAQLTARIFIGEEVCRDRAWIQNAIDYTANRTAAMKELHAYGRLIPLAHWFLPSCRALRRCVRAGRPFVERVLDARRSAAQGKGGDKSVDALSWIDGVAGENGAKYDATLTQLRLAYAAVHTTSDVMTKVVASLCEHEELIQPLREEIVAVVKEHGWSEAALAKMVLLDSVLKETQRLEPLASFTLSRIAREPVVLNDGTRIPKGTQVRLATDNMWNSSVYPDAARFDGYRFVKLREQEKNTNTTGTVGASGGGSGGGLSFVSVSPNHMGFGYGKHACPGRFFAGAETKIALCHILLKYDFELVDRALAGAQTDGMMIWRDKRAMLRVRRRREEVDI
ncbi:cytochrome P450 [Aspergillus ustus]|uniref:Cytochrome P450 n=1 Tax=Aspergillus ustus TaxID=40382 RepID=A0A0C1E1I8_ASPUT|nr:cytochrome P450 [Aspergillus ustus]